MCVGGGPGGGFTGFQSKMEMVDQVVCVCHSFKEVKVDLKEVLYGFKV